MHIHVACWRQRLQHHLVRRNQFVTLKPDLLLRTEPEPDPEPDESDPEPEPEPEPEPQPDSEPVNRK